MATCSETQPHAAAAAAPNPGQQQQHQQQQQLPSHLIVMVNGLWGFQKDWNKMQQALQAANKEGSCLIHVSGANTGAQTYDGLDVCGARLAAEITALAAANPSLTSISLLGHSMGGLTARYALGLLANPKTCKLAGLNPSHFISIAAPHLGCCSDHPEEVAWQERPYVHWLAAAVRAGHLGGAVAAAAPAAAAAAADTVASVAAGTAGMGSSKENSSSSSSKVWPWTPCRSVIQLLGCDAWTGPAAKPNSSSSSSSSSSPSNSCAGCTICACGKLDSSSSSLVVDAAGGDQQKQQQQHSGSSNTDSNDTNGTCAYCGSQEQQASQPLLLPSHGCCSCCGSGNLVLSSEPGEKSATAAAAAAAPPLLDVLAHDVLLRCSNCSAQHACCFLSGLQLFQHRVTYSSAGGDHLIPWASSSLLLPHQLPTWPGQLPAAALWTRQPVITQWPQPAAAAAEAPPSGKQQQQQQQDSLPQQQQEHDLQKDMHQPAEPLHTSGSASTTAAAAAAAGNRDHLKQGKTAAAAAAAEAAAAAPLSARLQKLQSVGSWAHFHVVWPRLCLGSSHCNIQYNGTINFVGRAVVDHVVARLMQPDKQLAGAAATSSVNEQVVLKAALLPQ